MIKKNEMDYMEIKYLPNFGILTDEIPKKLFDKLLSESDYAELKNPDLVSGCTDKGVAKHKYLIDTKDEFLKYITKIFVTYDKNFPRFKNIRLLTKDLNFNLDNPWLNYQRKGEYVPNHIHDGLFSYSLWLKIPTKSKFEFTYTNIIGTIEQYAINLTEEDEGKIIFFPAKLPLTVYPFFDSDDVRISKSGNISINSNGVNNDTPT